MGYRDAVLHIADLPALAETMALYRVVYDPQPVLAEDGCVSVAPERFGVMA